MKNKLFACFLGGKVKNSNLEIHDIAFVIGEKIEDCYKKIINQWCGQKNHVHIDAIIEFDTKILIVEKNKTKAIQKPVTLYFVNMGWVEKNNPYEQHKPFFIFAHSTEEAISNAKNTLSHLDKLNYVHHDNIIDVNDIIDKVYRGKYSLDLTNTKPSIINCNNLKHAYITL
jgi:Domain of Unknown Function (DUF1543)